MKSKLIALAASITIASGTLSYHLSSLPHPTAAQTNLITVLNSITIAGATAIFGLLDDEEEPKSPADATLPESKSSSLPTPPDCPPIAMPQPSSDRSESAD
jgi:hypothetical protein